jgi:hypothetical protein
MAKSLGHVVVSIKKHSLSSLSTSIRYLDLLGLVMFILEMLTVIV